MAKGTLIVILGLLLVLVVLGACTVLPRHSPETGSPVVLSSGEVTLPTDTEVYYAFFFTN